MDESVDDGADFERLLDQFVKRGRVTSETDDTEFVQLQDNRRLGIATLGALKQHPRIAAFREFLEGWYLSYFTPDAARGLPMAGPQRRLSIHGDNLANVVQYMQREHPNEFAGILRKIAGRVPGIDKIDTQRSEDGRLLLRFNDRGFVDPFYAQQMSDGTLKLFAYLLLMEDPNPPPFHLHRRAGKRPLPQAAGSPGRRVSRPRHRRKQRPPDFRNYPSPSLGRRPHARRSLGAAKG